MKLLRQLVRQIICEELSSGTNQDYFTYGKMLVKESGLTKSDSFTKWEFHEDSHPSKEDGITYIFLFDAINKTTLLKLTKFLNTKNFNIESSASIIHVNVYVSIKDIESRLSKGIQQSDIQEDVTFFDPSSIEPDKWDYS